MQRRLSADDWIDAGLAALARRGAGALKADLLAKALAVSRGSFYWHFADIGAFHAAVLARWRQVAADAIIAELETLSPPAERLRSLLRRAFTASVSLEVAVRAWAAHDAAARKMVAAVDKRRLAYIEDLLTAAGTAPAAASARAHVIYWAYLGFALSRRRRQSGRLGTVLDELAAIGLTR